MRGGCSAFSIATGSGLSLGGDRLPEWVLRRIEELIHLLHLCLKLGGIVRLLLDMRCATVVEVHILGGKTHAIGTDKVFHVSPGGIGGIGNLEVLHYDHLRPTAHIGCGNGGLAGHFHTLAVLKVHGLVVYMPAFVQHTGERYNKVLLTYLVGLP